MGFSRQEYWSGVPSPSPASGLGKSKQSCGLPLVEALQPGATGDTEEVSVNPADNQQEQRHLSPTVTGNQILPA